MGTEALDFDWDEFNSAHIARHGVTPAEVENALTCEPLDVKYDIIDGEQRWTSLWHTAAFRVLLVVWTMRMHQTRPITAREVSRLRTAEYLRYKRRLG